ncbi:HNH endonuclease [Salmonella enterica]|nr:HNH endonuclease [Salmonella enterica]
MGKYKDIDYEQANNYFYYDETSPSFLRWKVNRGNKKAGDIAGGKDNAGYYNVSFNKQTYKAHRVVFCIMNGGINSDLMIDHIDRNPANNNIWNLREGNYELNNNNKCDSNPENRITFYNNQWVSLPANVSKSDRNGRDYYRAQYDNPDINKRETKSSYDLQTVLDWLFDKVN